MLSSKHFYRWIGVVSVIAVILLWQLCASTGLIDRTVTSDPLSVIDAAAEYFSSGRAATDLAVSGRELFFGYALALIGGVLVGVLVGLSRLLSAILDPFVNLLNAMPRVALAPLFVIWLGIGLESKVAVVSLTAVFPILISTAAGIRTVDPALPNMTRSFGAGRLFVIRHVMLPSAAPSIAAGARIGIANAIVGVVVAELIASTNGVGNLVISAGSNFEPALLMVGILILAAASAILTALLRLVEKRLERWRPA